MASHMHYVGQSLIWSMILVGIGVNGYINWHQGLAERGCREDRSAIRDELRELQQKVRNIRAHQVREAIRRGEPVVNDEELFPPPKE